MFSIRNSRAKDSVTLRYLNRNPDKWTRSEWMAVLREPLTNLGMVLHVKYFIELLYIPPDVSVNCLVFKFSGGAPPWRGYRLISSETQLLKSYHTKAEAVKSISRWWNSREASQTEIKVLIQQGDVELPRHVRFVDGNLWRWLECNENDTIQDIFFGRPKRYLCIMRPMLGYD